MAGRFVVLVFAGLGSLLVVSCGSDDSSEGAGCVAGEKVSCSCWGGEGVKVCNADGSGYGPCMGCGNGSGGWPGVDGGGAGGTAGASGGSAGAGGGAGAELDAETPDAGIVSHSWIWQDYGGPAYQPAPCSAAVGVVDGKLVDPQAFFSSLIQGTDPNNWVQVLNEIEPQLWACGLGQQRDSGGNVRGRLYLPHAACPDASPPADDAKAKFLGVNQLEDCWAHFVDVVGNN